MDREAIGRAIRTAREAAGLSRAELARRAGVAEGTLKNAEHAKHEPSMTVLRPVAQVLGLDLAQLLGEAAASRAEPTPLNCWLSGAADPLQMTRRLRQVLQGAGGQIDQDLLYIDPLAAEAWKRLAAQPEYCRARDALPLHLVAAAAAERVGLLPIDVVGLGCGDGAAEIRLTRFLRGLHAAQVHLQLLDISLPLLAHAHAAAAAQLGEGVEAHNGSFHELPRYPHLLPRPGRARMLCMFGNTFANLENELLWARSTLASYAPGDLLLLDITRVRAPADRPDEVRAADARLSRPLTALEQEHLVGPIERYGRYQAQDVQIRAELDLTCCPVPGSYGVRQVATVGGKRFGAVLIKRYVPELLGEALRGVGWEPVPGGLWQEERDALLLLRRV